MQGGTGRLSISPGLAIRVLGTRCVILELAGETVRLRHTETGQVKSIELSALLDGINSEQIKYAESPEELGTSTAKLTGEEINLISRIPIDEHSQAAIDVMLEKLRILRALQMRGFTAYGQKSQLALAIREVRRDQPGTIDFRPSTIRAAALRLATTGDPRSLLPQFLNRGGRGKTRVPVESEAFVEKALEAARKASGPLRISDLHTEVRTEIRIANMSGKHSYVRVPSRQTISRRFHSAFSKYDVALRNRGRSYVAKKFKETSPRIRAEVPGECYQFDDTDMEVFLIDKRSGLSWGRPFLTVAIDEASLAIVGFQISESARSNVSAISCLANAVQTKNMSDPAYARCKGRWVGYGVPGVIVMDNALYNHSEAIEKAITDMGAIPGWSKPYTPTGKSQVENLNHIIKQEFSQFLAGYRGRKGTHEGLREGEETARLDLDEFRARFVEWVVDVYSDTPRRNGLTPREIWNAHYVNRSPLLPHSIASTILIGTLPEDKTLRSTGGILRKRLHYQSAGLQAMRASVGSSARVKIRYDPHDLSRIYVKCGRNYMEVPCATQLPAEGLTDYQQTLYLKKQRLLTGNTRPSEGSVMEARRSVRADVERDAVSKKLTARKRAVLAGKLPNVDPSVRPAAPAPIAKSLSEQAAAAFDDLSSDNIHYPDKLEADDDI